MGVTYKLKQEVIDFIVSSKYNAPTLSCRKMVSLIKDHFSIEVSKSSVNAVMKDASLSSPVGRPARAPASKFFAIPPDKKETLLKNVASFLGPAITPVPVVDSPPLLPPEPLPQIPDSLPVWVRAPQEVPPIVADKEGSQLEELSMAKNLKEPATEISAVLPPAEELLAIAPPETPVFLGPVAEIMDDVAEGSDEQRQEIVDVPTEEPRDVLSLPEDLLHKNDPIPREIALMQEERSTQEHRPVWHGDLGDPREHTGLFLMLTALWGVSKTPRIGSLIGTHLGQDDSLARSFEAALVAHYFGQGTELPLTFSSAVALDMPALAQNKALVQALASEIATMETLGALIRVRFDNGAEIFLDPLHSSFSGDPKAARTVAAPLFFVVERAAACLVAADAPLVIGCLAGATLDETSRAVLSSLDGRNDLKMVDVLSHDEDTLLSFAHCLPGARKVIAGVMLSSAQAAAVELKMIDNGREFYDPLAQQSLIYLEGFLPEYPELVNYKVIIVRPKEVKGGENRYILTNMRANPDSVLKAYFRLFWNLTSHLKADDSQKYDRIVGLDDIFKLENTKHAPLENSHADFDILLRRFLLNITRNLTGIPDQDSLLDALRLSGYYKETAHDIFIRLCVPADSALAVLLQRAFSLIHARGVCAPVGKRLHFSLERI